MGASRREKMNWREALDPQTVQQIRFRQGFKPRAPSGSEFGIKKSFLCSVSESVELQN